MSETAKPMQGELLAPETRMPATAAHTPPPQIGGPTFWVKWRYGSAREKAQAYTEFLRSLTDTVNVTQELERAIEKRDLGLARLERLGDLREAEHLKIDAELENLRVGVTAQRLSARTTLASLEEEAVAAERRLTRAKDDADKPQEDTVSPARRGMELIKKLRAEHAEIIKEMKEAVGETLSQADEDLIHRMEIALNDRINRIISEMRDA